MTTQSRIAKLGDLSPLYDTYQIEHSPSRAEVPVIRAVRLLSTVDPQDAPPRPGIVCHQLIVMFFMSTLKPLAMHSRLPELHEMVHGLVEAKVVPLDTQGKITRTARTTRNLRLKNNLLALKMGQRANTSLAIRHLSTDLGMD
jgi:hypothetical protein